MATAPPQLTGGAIAVGKRVAAGVEWCGRHGKTGCGRGDRGDRTLPMVIVEIL